MKDMRVSLLSRLANLLGERCNFTYHEVLQSYFVLLCFTQRKSILFQVLTHAGFVLIADPTREISTNTISVRRSYKSFTLEESLGSTMNSWRTGCCTTCTSKPVALVDPKAF